MTQGVWHPDPKPAPEKLTAYHCNACGRFTFFHPFKHSAWGSICSGVVEVITYERKETS